MFAGRAVYNPPVKTYNSSTGVLTITGNSLTAILGEIDSGVFTSQASGGATLSSEVYLVIGEMK